MNRLVTLLFLVALVEFSLSAPTQAEMTLCGPNLPIANGAPSAPLPPRVIFDGSMDSVSFSSERAY